MECKVIGVRNPANSWWLGKIVTRKELIVAGSEMNGDIKPDTGFKCLFGVGTAYFHPDDLEEC